MRRSTYEENKKEREKMDKRISGENWKKHARKEINEKKWQKLADNWSKNKKTPKMIFLNHKRKNIEMSSITNEEIEREIALWFNSIIN